MEAVGGLFLGGISLRWREIWPDASRVHDLPTYVWKRRPYWLTGEVGLQTGLTSQCSLLGSPLQVASNPEISVFQSLVSIDQPGWLNDHQVNGRKIVPASAWVEMAMAAPTPHMERSATLSCSRRWCRQRSHARSRFPSRQS